MISLLQSPRHRVICANAIRKLSYALAGFWVEAADHFFAGGLEELEEQVLASALTESG